MVVDYVGGWEWHVRREFGGEAAVVRLEVLESERVTIE
jgi:hypothetical protein